MSRETSEVLGQPLWKWRIDIAKAFLASCDRALILQIVQAGPEALREAWRRTLRLPGVGPNIKDIPFEPNQADWHYIHRYLAGHVFMAPARVAPEERADYVPDTVTTESVKHGVKHWKGKVH